MSMRACINCGNAFFSQGEEFCSPGCRDEYVDESAAFYSKMTPGAGVEVEHYALHLPHRFKEDLFR